MLFYAWKKSKEIDLIHYFFVQFLFFVFFRSRLKKNYWVFSGWHTSCWFMVMMTMMRLFLSLVLVWLALLGFVFAGADPDRFDDDNFENGQCLNAKR